MPATFDRPLYTDETERLIAAWHANPVVTDAKAFTPIPSSLKLKVQRLFGKHLTVQESKALDLPPIEGFTGPQWMWDRDGHFAVVKRNVTHQPLTNPHFSAPREVIVPYLLDGIMPMAPNCLWEHKDPYGKTVYSSASLVVLENFRDWPPDEVLKTSTFFPPIVIVDQFIKQADRKRDGLLWGTTSENEHPVTPGECLVVPVDHGYSLYGRKEEPVNIQLDYTLHHFSRAAVEHARQSVFSPAAQRTTHLIQNIPDSDITGIVKFLPDTSYEHRFAKQGIIDLAMYRRDNLEQLVLDGAKPSSHAMRPDFSARYSHQTPPI